MQIWEASKHTDPDPQHCLQVKAEPGTKQGGRVRKIPAKREAGTESVAVTGKKKVKKEEVVKIELETEQVKSLPKRKTSATVKGKLKKDLKGIKVETDISDGGLQQMKSVPLRKSNRSVSRDKSYSE
jgi:hypothetical protein